jgi:hypothetical protein
MVVQTLMTERGMSQRRAFVASDIARFVIMWNTRLS